MSAGLSPSDASEVLNALCRQSFDAFAERAFRIVDPGVVFEHNWHISCIAEHLEAMYRGEIKRLIINLPPRSLKSYLVSAAYPAWVLGKKPQERFINTGYGGTVVEQNARNCRAMMRDEWYQQCFPETIINPNMDRLTHFETTMKGQYYAATALSPITGVGCDVMILDDPIKPMEAFSETVRASTNQNIRTTLLNRFNDKRTGQLLVVMQRAHVDDPTGNLLADGGDLVHLKLPAETNKRISISLNGLSWTMEPDSYLFPQRLGRKELDEIKRDMTELHYVGQYLQEPVPIGGGEFKPTWLNYYNAGGVKPREMNIVILVDAAAGDETNKKKKKASDWSAFIVIGLAPDNNYYLLDAIRDRLNPTERVDTLMILHRKWNELGGKSPKVGYEKYGMMTDTHYIQKKQAEENYRFPLVELGGSMNKEDRIRRLIPDMQNGRWWLPATLLYCDSEGRTFDLIKELVSSEMASFPRARYDDMLDAMSRIKEDDLFMSFPKQLNKSAKSSSINSGAGSWLDY